MGGIFLAAAIADITAIVFVMACVFWIASMLKV